MKQLLRAGAVAAFVLGAPSAVFAGELEGAYVGINAGGIATWGTFDKFIGVYGGYNMRFSDRFIGGAEAEATYDPGTNAQTYMVSGRIGYEVIEGGMTYLKAGGGFQPTVGGIWAVGLGVETLVPDTPLGARVEAEYMDGFAAGTPNSVRLKGGLHYDF
ncbi:MAG: outer membrane protein [Maritimibacter sp.]